MKTIFMWTGLGGSEMYVGCGVGMIRFGIYGRLVRDRRMCARKERSHSGLAFSSRLACAAYSEGRGASTIGLI